MHGFPWWFGLMLEPATWIIAMLVLGLGVLLVALRKRWRDVVRYIGLVALVFLGTAGAAVLIDQAMKSWGAT